MSDTPKKPHQADKQMFSNAVSDISPIEQDRIIPFSDTNRVFIQQRNFVDTDKFIDNLSDSYDPFENEQQKNDLNYHHQSISKKKFQSFKKGRFESEQILDLHGLNRQEARRELLAFLHYCNKQNYRLVSIMPGYGKGILREALNIWLRQIPRVLAFAESPQQSGGKGVIRLLLAAQKDF